MTLRLALMLTVAVIAMAPHRSAATESLSVAGQTLARLRSEGVLEWQDMARKLDCSSFDYTIREIDQKGKTTRERTKRVSGRVAGPSFLFTETLVPDEQASVYGRNDRYEFALVRNANSPWTITWQSSRRDDDTPVGSAYAYLAGMLRLPWSISATPLANLANDSRFSIQNVRQVDQGDLQIDFMVEPTAMSPDGLQGLKSGSILLSPARHWAVQRYSVHYTNKMSSSLQLTYGPSGPPELTRVDFKLDVSPEMQSKFSIDVGKYEWAAVQTAEFTLPAFGLPDYRDPLNRRRWLVLVNSGIVMVLVGLIVWRRRREIA